MTDQSHAASRRYGPHRHYEWHDPDNSRCPYTDSIGVSSPLADWCHCPPPPVSSAALRREPWLSVRGHGFVIEVNDHGLWIDRQGAGDKGGFLFVPLAEIPALGELVERAYTEGKEAKLWP